MTSSELADHAAFKGMQATLVGDDLILSTEHSVNFLFTRTVTERWQAVGAGYCRIEAAPSA